MKHPVMALAVLALLGMGGCSRPSADRLLGTWKAEEKMPTKMYLSHLPSDPSRPDPKDPGVDVALPLQVTFTSDQLKMTLGPSEQPIQGRAIHAPILHIDKSYSLVSARGDDLVLAIDNDKSLKPFLNTVHFVSADRFWMTNSGDPASSAAMRMWFQRVR